MSTSLDRWLGRTYVPKLTRARGVLTIPAFAVNPLLGWNAKYSRKELQFNYQISRRFSLNIDSIEALMSSLVLTLGHIKTNPSAFGSFAWCVKMNGPDLINNKYQVVRRYVLNPDDEVIPDSEEYEGQVINGFFQLEAWNKPGITATNVSLASPVTIDSTILSPDSDQRYSGDFSIGDAAVTVTNFQLTNPSGPSVYNIPITFSKDSVGDTATSL